MWVGLNILGFFFPVENASFKIFLISQDFMKKLKFFVCSLHYGFVVNHNLCIYYYILLLATFTIKLKSCLRIFCAFFFFFATPLNKLER